MDLELLFQAAEILKGSRFTHLFLVLSYLLASVLVFPFSIMDTFTIAVFGPVQGAIYAYFLSSFCALWMFILVRYFRKKPARIPEKVIPAQWAHVLNRPGCVAVAIFRNLPIAFSINNVIFALSSIKTRDYLIGTLIGNIFPILFLSVVFSQTQKAFTDPGLWQFACLALVLLTAFSLYRLFRKRIRFNAAYRQDLRRSGADSRALAGD